MSRSDVHVLRCALLSCALLFTACSSSSSSDGGGSGGGSGGGTGGPISGELGAPCTRNSDCHSELCLATGVCTESCTSVSSCPQSWTCDAIPNAGTLCNCTKSSSTTEVCDGIDNNCDGQVDEGATCAGGLVCQGGSCSCPAARSCGGDAGTCSDPMTDPINCGGCGNVCGNGQKCDGSGQCACPSNLTNCNGTCVDTTQSSANCNTCGNACGGGEVCVGSACVCAGGTTLCGNACIDLQSSAANCNACGHACPSGNSCILGACSVNCGSGTTKCGTACVNEKTDNANCGGCGTTCTGGKICTNGSCALPPVTPGGACAADTDCGTGGMCRSATSGWPGGYCYYSPTLDCQVTCPTGGACSTSAFEPFLVANMGQAFVCMKECTTNANCRAGYVCNTSGGPGDGVCVPSCLSNADVCDPGQCGSDGACIYGCTTEFDCGLNDSFQCNAQEGLCVCNSGSDCGAYSACNTETGECGCSDDAFCPTGRTCELSTGECM